MTQVIPFIIAALLTPQDLARQFTSQRNFEASESILRVVKPTRQQLPEYSYLRAINAFSLNRKTDAERWCRNLIDSFDTEFEPPTRHTVLAILMLNDMESWTRDGLDDIGRDMQRVSDRLADAKGGAQTQELQKDIVNRLDKLIKQKEDQLKQQQSAGASGQGKNDDAGRQDQPQTDSIGGQDRGPGKVDEKKLKELAEVWGKLPERKRAEAMRELTRDMPVRYRDVIEKYFRKLADTQEK